MSDERGAVVSARTKIPRMVSVPVGKENVGPAVRRPAKTRPTENAARRPGRRFCGALESEKRPGGGSRGRLCAPSILKEAPFRVHCDDENSAAVREGKLRPAAVREIVPLPVVASEEAKAQRPSHIPRWRWDRTRSTERLSGFPGRGNDGGLARLEVGKRSRSASTGSGRKIRRRSGSLVVERLVRPTAAAAGHGAGAEPTKRNALGGGSAADAVDTADEPAKRRGKLAGEKGEGGGGGGGGGGRRRRRAEGGQVGPIGIVDRAASAARRGGRPPVCVATPLDGPPPIPPQPVKANRESKARARRNLPLARLALGCVENREKRRNGKEEEEDLFPVEMLRHAEYARDLPVVEREREDLGPRLSGNFLRGRFNAEQRRLVVAFLIHLSSHHRYPSFAVYQAVKLFDVAMDRAPASTVYVQLTALAALWIVLKRHQVREKVPTATTMVSLANDLYAGREGLLFEYERRILRAVDFNLSFPDAFSLYAYHLVECSRYAKIPERSTTFLRHCGGYLIDLTLLDEDLCGLSGCLVAFVAAELALGLVLDEGPAAWSTSGQPRWKFCRMLVRAASPRSGRFPSEEIVALRGAMLRRIRSSAERRSAFECVYRKYNRTKYGRISESLVRMAKTICEESPVDT